MDFSRQELILGKKSQKLIKSKVSIIGLGALGSLSSELLVRSGIKNLILIDRDYIEESNLQRQLYSKQDVGKPKVLVSKERLEKINPEIKIEAIFDHLDENNINKLKSDLILDCTDNLQTRFLIDEFCYKNKIPWIFSSAIKQKGYVFNILKDCRFKDIFNNLKIGETCEEVGVLNTITSLISSIQVNEAIKILTNNNPEKDLIYVNLENNEILKLKVNKTNNKFDYKINSEKLCGGSFIFPLNKSYSLVKNKFKNLKINDYKIAFSYKNITVFKNKVLIKTKSKKEAESLYSKYIGN